jgi:hypothetical protein
MSVPAAALMTPMLRLPEIRLRAAGVVPPTVFGPDAMLRPFELAAADAPSAMVPMKQPSTVLPVPPAMRTPAKLPRKLLTTRPRTVVPPPPALMSRPLKESPPPSSTILSAALLPAVSVLAEEPGCV